jgi:hypothetical protein
VRDGLEERQLGRNTGHRFALRNKPSKKPKTSRGKLAFVLAVISIIGTILTLIGYGVAIAAEDVLGVPHQILFTSPFELLQLSVWAVLQGLDEIVHVNLWTGLFDLLRDFAPIVLLVFLVLNSVAWFAKSSVPSFIERRGLRERLRTLVAPPRVHDSSKWLAAKFAILSTLFWVTLPLLALAAFFSCSFVLVVLVLIPDLGMQAGARHLNRYVIRPQLCEPISTRSARLAPKTVPTTKTDMATCVRISSQQGVLGIGRVVFTTSSAMILFDPATGRTSRVPIKDAIVETVGTLDTPLGTKGNLTSGLALEKESKGPL